MVRFSYQAENDDELRLNEGEIITVLDQEIEDSGWWRGEVEGRVGVFPDNFVELIPEEEVRIYLFRNNICVDVLLGCSVTLI